MIIGPSVAARSMPSHQFIGSQVGGQTQICLSNLKPSTASQRLTTRLAVRHEKKQLNRPLQTTSALAQNISRFDYKTPTFNMPSIDLTFDIQHDQTLVTSHAHYNRVIGDHLSQKQDLVLDGNAQRCDLISLKLNGKTIPFNKTEDSIRISSYLLHNLKAFAIECVTSLTPENNTTLAGLYKSKGIYTTQCEAEGFRNMTYVQDRPDVLSQFTTTIIADKTILLDQNAQPNAHQHHQHHQHHQQQQQQQPIMLSNGNCIATGTTKDGRDFVQWYDPFPKPTYLFALVAGQLTGNHSQYTTNTGQTIKLNIYAQHPDTYCTDYAMQSLKAAMQWDEAQFGLEYDLDEFNIVAIDDFNMGAMENKGLNIFNSKLIVATPETATDTDYKNIERVIGHEYFHNWTGNRVTCRDWFQLSLKEGLTVFRDQEFSSDMNSRVLKRIHDVTSLRNIQFPEDASPMAHPIRPDAIAQFDNLYTPTVYHKGAEIIRMMSAILGTDNFRQGMDLYFKRHDGTAVTCEDFIQAMEDASGQNLTQFRRWYSQVGTPTVEVSTQYRPEYNQFEISFRQSLPDTGTKTQRLPLVIPIQFGLMKPDGQPINFRRNKALPEKTDKQIVLQTRVRKICFFNIEQAPIPSVGRHFSAPAIFKIELNTQQLMTQMKHDQDYFKRYEAAQTLIENEIIARAEDNEFNNAQPWLQAMGELFQQDSITPGFMAQVLNLPTTQALQRKTQGLELNQLRIARSSLVHDMAHALQTPLMAALYAVDFEGKYDLSPTAIEQRALAQTALTTLAAINQPEIETLANTMYFKSNNLTSKLTALNALNILAQYKPGCALAALQDFDLLSQKNSLVRLKFLSLIASGGQDNTLDQVKKLWHSIDHKNPNSVYALLGGFMKGSYAQFHHPSGHGYRFVSQAIAQVDRINPQAAAKIMSGFQVSATLDMTRKIAMRNNLILLAQQPLSNNTREIIDKLIG